MAKRIIDWQFSLHITLCILVMEGKKKEYHIYENVNYSRPHTNHNAMETFTFHHIEAYILYLKLRYSTLSEWGKKRAHFMLHQKIASAKMVNNNDNHLLLTMLFNAISFFHNHKNSTHTHNWNWVYGYCYDCSIFVYDYSVVRIIRVSILRLFRHQIEWGLCGQARSLRVIPNLFLSPFSRKTLNYFPDGDRFRLELWISSISKARFRVDFEQSLKYLHILFKLSIWWPK